MERRSAAQRSGKCIVEASGLEIHSHKNSDVNFLVPFIFGFWICRACEYFHISENGGIYL